jgi:hypothetical protein
MPRSKQFGIGIGIDIAIAVAQQFEDADHDHDCDTDAIPIFGRRSICHVCRACSRTSAWDMIGAYV